MKDDTLLEENTLRPIGMLGVPEIEEITSGYYRKEELAGKEVFDSTARSQRRN